MISNTKITNKSDAFKCKLDLAMGTVKLVLTSVFHLTAQPQAMHR